MIYLRVCSEMASPSVLSFCPFLLVRLVHQLMLVMHDDVYPRKVPRVLSDDSAAKFLILSEHAVGKGGGGQPERQMPRSPRNAGAVADQHNIRCEAIL